jgi:hypothetical protein
MGFDGRPIHNTYSKYKGVTRTKNDPRWRVQFYFGKRHPFTVGYYDSEEDAARAYDNFALQHRGPGTFLNLRDLGPKTDPVVEADRVLIPLSSGKHCIIDKEDLDKVAGYYWNDGGHSIARHGMTLHETLLGELPKNHVVTHINGDPLDFRKDNLVIAPWVLHHGRHRKRKKCKSIYKGVRLRSPGHWHVRIGRKHIGAFDNEIDAALAYDEAARRKYGLFAALNFPREGEVGALCETTMPRDCQESVMRI